MRRCYVGLFSSPTTLENFNGTLVRPELVTTKESNSSVDWDSFLAAGAKAKVDYYCVHVVEVAVRPDVELKKLMASVSAILRTQTGAGSSSWKPSGLRYSYIQRSHGLVSRLPLNDHRITSPAVVSATAPEPEWDLVDVQVNRLMTPFLVSSSLAWNFFLKNTRIRFAYQRNKGEGCCCSSF